MIAPDDIVFVQQPTKVSCVAAVMAMVTGEPVNSVIEELRCFTDGAYDDDVITFCMKRDIFPMQLVNFGVNPFPYYGCYMVTVPSLNNLGGLHAVLVTCSPETNKMTVYDPNYGLEDGSRWYEPDALRLPRTLGEKLALPYTEVVYLRDMN